MTVTEGTVLWEPSEAVRRASTMQHYLDWLSTRDRRTFASYSELWGWSVAELEAFWASLWEFFQVQATPYTSVLDQRQMPGARWFAGAELNYAAHVFRNATPDHPALIFQQEGGQPAELSWEQLRDRVAALVAGLRAMGVGRGDRVVAYLPNIPEAVVAFLACASLGAVWSSCSPDMGEGSVVDRFKQIAPKLLFATDGYQYGGKTFDRRPTVAALRRELTTLEQTVLVHYLRPDGPTEGLDGVLSWEELVAGAHSAPALTFEPVPFDHPLWVLYSSGTTGLPKPIVQGHGGILLEHLKSICLHMDLKPGDRFFWFTTTGWMMWNLLVSGLLGGCTVLLYDGSPAFPTMNALWDFAATTGMDYFGASAAYIAACMKNGVAPAEGRDLGKLRALGSTGSPLPVEGFAWVYEQVKRDLWLASVSGGTDVCTAFVGGCPLLPVHAGEIQCICLGVAAAAFNEDGQPVVDQVGELVVTAPMPSMPLFFWNDPGDRRYRESYFEVYPGIWRHGDWVKLTARGSLVIYGRSDATINRMGIRMGTSELYRAVEDIPEVLDSLVIDLEGLGGRSFMPLFVVLRPGITLDEALAGRIKDRIRTTLSARHVPDAVVAIPEVPRTLNGKKMELPIKKILLGSAPEKAANPDSMSNPHTLAVFVEYAKGLGAGG
ncbi:MAG: acetoacetate--CoA ligase [Roseiflexaceae bacterium]